MIFKPYSFIVFLISLFLPSLTYSEEEWRFTLTPYIWAATINSQFAGSSDGGGGEPPPINPDYQFFSLENLEGAWFVNVKAEKGQWTIHTDILGLSFADGFQVSILEANFGLDGHALEVVGGYRPVNWPHTELLAGARGVKIDVFFEMPPLFDLNGTEEWVDVILGVRHTQPFTTKLSGYAKGDIGGFDLASRQTLNLQAGLSYQFTSNVAGLLGYRYQVFEFTRDHLLDDLRFLGYQMGVQWTF